MNNEQKAALDIVIDYLDTKVQAKAFSDPDAVQETADLSNKLEELKAAGE